MEPRRFAEQAALSLKSFPPSPTGARHPVLKCRPIQRVIQNSAAAFWPGTASPFSLSSVSHSLSFSLHNSLARFPAASIPLHRRVEQVHGLSFQLFSHAHFISRESIFTYDNHSYTTTPSPPTNTFCFVCRLVYTSPPTSCGDPRCQEENNFTN